MEFALIIHLLTADVQGKEKEIFSFPDFNRCQVARDNLRSALTIPASNIVCEKREMHDMAFTGRAYTQ